MSAAPGSEAHRASESESELESAPGYKYPKYSSSDIAANRDPEIPPLDTAFYILSPSDKSFLKHWTGISDDEELRAHVLTVQKEAYEVCFC